MVQKLYNSRLKPYKIKQKMCNGKWKAIQKPGLSAKSIKNIHSVLHEALDKAVELRYIRYNVSDAATLPKVVKSEMHPVEGENVKEFLNAIKGNPMENLLYVTAFSGMRQGEVIGLTWDCIDFNKKTIRIYRQLQKERKVGGEYKFAPLKNDKQRVFMVADDVLGALRRVKSKQAEWKLAAGENWQNEENFVFMTELGRHLSKCTVYESFKRCAKEAGIPETRFHDLRHTYATLALEQGTDIKTVYSNLGHATVAFTLDTYGHVTEKMQQDSADRMQRYLESI
jgi:integrase